MEEPFGFLESEFERALTTMVPAPAADNVVQISDSLRSRDTLRVRERRFRELLGALPAAVYTTDAAGAQRMPHGHRTERGSQRARHGSGCRAAGWHACTVHSVPDTDS